MFNFKTHRNYLFLIGIIVVVFFLRECQTQKNTNDLVHRISTYSDIAKHYKMANGNMLAYNKTLKLQNQKQLKALIATNEQIKDEIKKIKHLRDVTTIKQQTLIRDTIKIQPNSIPCDFTPFELRKDNKHYLFKGILSPTDFVIDTLSIPNEINVMIGRKKIGFMKYEEQVNVVNSNPYVTTTNLSNLSVQRDKKWHERGWVKFGAGVVGGGVVASQIKK